MRSPANRRTRSSSAERKKRDLAGVALTAGTTAQLVVDAPGLVALGAADVEAAELLDLLALAARPGPRSFGQDLGQLGLVVLVVGLDACACAARCWPCSSALPPSLMSTPRPAMLVAIVTAPGRPAWAIVSASRSAYSGLAFSTSCGTPFFFRRFESFSEVSTAIVPTRIGWPFSWRATISRSIADHLPSLVL